MLLLSKLDRTKILVTLETIKYIEETPDTLIRFLNGETVMVRESLEEIGAAVDSMRRRLIAEPHPVESISVQQNSSDGTQLS